LRGSGLDAVWVDEVQDIQGDQFWPVVRPLVSDRRGKIVISGQHRGKTSWYYESLFERGMNGTPGYRSWQIPSWRGMVYLSEAGRQELIEAKAQIPRVVWEQEYECLPTANQNSVFRPDDIDAAMIGRHQIRNESSHDYCLAVDIGRVVDRCGIVVIDCTDGCVCFEELRPKGETHERTADRCAEIWQAFGRCYAVVDRTGGGTGGHRAYDEFTRHYVERIEGMQEYVWNSANKEQAVNAMSLAFEQKRLKIAPELEQLKRQLLAYEYIYKGGRFQYQGPNGHDDDLVAALAMGYHQYAQGRVRGAGYGSLAGVI